MRVSKAQALENRGAIVDAAAKLYRERGFGGVGLAEITGEAGFTHGGFYRHFPSKEGLMAEAMSRTFESGVHRFDGTSEDDIGPAGFIRRYLRLEHRDNPGQGCPMPTLASESVRQSQTVQDAFAQGIGSYLNALAVRRPDGSQADPVEPADKSRAIATLSALVGGMVLARATASALPELSEEILATLRLQLGEQWNAVGA